MLHSWCFGFRNTYPNPPTDLPPAGTLLGGITFRDVLVRYDRGSRRVGFAHAACRELGQQQRPPCAQLEAEGIATVGLSDTSCHSGG